MADEPENHTVRLLQEMRTEISGMRKETRGGFADVNLRIDGVTPILTLRAGVSHDHEERLGRLETDR